MFFGPKISGSRSVSNDDALESRIINIRMAETKSDDIPLRLNEQFDKDSEELRCKLLKWRLDNYDNVREIQKSIMTLLLKVSQRELMKNVFSSDLYRTY